MIFGILCRKPKKEKTATKPTQGAELLKRKKKGFLPETKKRKNRKKGIQENGVEAGEGGEPAPEEQPLGTQTPKNKKGPVPGGSKKHPSRGGRENGVAKAGGGDLPTADEGEAVADKKKKKRKRKNRKRKGAAGDEAEQVPAAKKTKGSVVQETQKQDKSKKKRKEKQVLQE